MSVKWKAAVLAVSVLGTSAQAVEPFEARVDALEAARKRNGTVVGWGLNASRELGTGTDRQESPVQVLGLTEVVSAAAGSNHSLVLKADGTVWG